VAGAPASRPGPSHGQPGPQWSYYGMTSVSKLAISLPAPLAARARRAVRKGRAASVSAYIASALESQATLDDLAALLDEMLDASGGPLTAAERRAADRALGVARSPRTR